MKRLVSIVILLWVSIVVAQDVVPLRHKSNGNPFLESFTEAWTFDTYSSPYTGMVSQIVMTNKGGTASTDSGAQRGIMGGSMIMTNSGHWLQTPAYDSRFAGGASKSFTALWWLNGAQGNSLCGVFNATSPSTYDWRLVDSGPQFQITGTDNNPYTKNLGFGSWDFTRFHMFVGGYDAPNNRIFLSFDGQAKSFTTLPGGVSVKDSGTLPLTLEWINGACDEFYFWNRVLADNEITNLFNADTNGVGWGLKWPFTDTTYGRNLASSWGWAVTNNGATVSSSTYSACIDFINGLTADGLLAKFNAVYVFAPDNFQTALIPLLSPTFVQAPGNDLHIETYQSYTHRQGYVSADLSLSGLSGVFAQPATKYSAMSVYGSAGLGGSATTVWPNPNDAGFSIVVPTAYSEPSGFQFGFLDNGLALSPGALFRVNSFDGTSSGLMGDTSTQLFTNTPAAGFYSVNRGPAENPGNLLYNNLVHYYPLTEGTGTFHDYGSRTVNLTGLNSSSGLSQVAGHVSANATRSSNNGNSFDGISSIVASGSDFTGDNSGTGHTPMSFCCWFNMDSSQPFGPTSPLFSIVGSSGSSQSYVLRKTGANQIQWSMSIFGGAGGASVTYNSITDGAWHLAVCGFDFANGQIWMSIDNSAKQTASLATLNEVSTEPFYVFNWHITAVQAMGILSDIGVWNNRVLDTTDIGNLWNGGAGLPISQFTSSTPGWMYAGNPNITFGLYAITNFVNQTVSFRNIDPLFNAAKVTTVGEYYGSSNKISFLATHTHFYTAQASNLYNRVIALRDAFGGGLFPILTTSPTNTLVLTGNNATLYAAAPGGTTYQWKKNGSPIAGATQSTYTITGASASDFSQYTVAATLSGQIDSASVELYVADTTTVSNWWFNAGPKIGTTLASNSVYAINNLYNGLVTDGLDVQTVALTVFVPDGLNSALVPLVSTAGNNPWQNINFVDADLTINGLTGNSSSKYLNTGVQGSAFTLNSSGVIIYGYNVIAPGAAQYDFGYTDNAGTVGMFAAKMHDSDGHTYGYQYSNVGGTLIDFNPSPGNGFYSWQRVSSTKFDLYFANSGSAHSSLQTATGASSGALQNQNMYLFAVLAWQGPSPFGYSGNTISACALTKGLSASDDSKYYNRLQTCRQTLGGGFR